MSKPDAKLRNQQNGHWWSSDFPSALAACADLERWAAEIRGAGGVLRDYRAAVINSCPDEVVAFVSARDRWAEDFGDEWFPIRDVDANVDDLQVWFAGSLGGRTVLLRDLPTEIAAREQAPVLNVTKPWTVRGLGWSRHSPELDEVRTAHARAKRDRR